MLLEGIAGIVLGFHAQQAVEKLLKALLCEKGLKFPRTHDIESLVQPLLVTGEVLPVTPIPLKELNGYAVVYGTQTQPSFLLPTLRTPSRPSAFSANSFSAASPK